MQAGGNRRSDMEERMYAESLTLMTLIVFMFKDIAERHRSESSEIVYCISLHKWRTYLVALPPLDTLIWA